MALPLPHPTLHGLDDAQDNFDAVARLAGLLGLLYNPGDLKATAVAVAAGAEPVGWLLCDGRAVSRIDYDPLFRAIGIVYGAGNGSTTFNLPPTPGRALVGAGAGSGLTARALGAAFGEENHLLSVAEMPSHNHGGATGGPAWAGSQGSNIYSTGGATNFVAITWAGAFIGGDVNKYNDFAHTHSISSQGGGGTHNNMQPALAVNVLIKT